MQLTFFLKKKIATHKFYAAIQFNTTGFYEVDLLTRSLNLGYMYNVVDGEVLYMML